MPNETNRPGAAPADRFFDGYAGDFDSIYGDGRGLFQRLLDRMFRRSMWLRYRRTIEGCRPIEGRAVLDIGCGPGHYGVTLAARGAGRVVLLDFAPQMLNLARARAEAAGVAARCEFNEGSFEAYRPDARFDFSIVMGVMDYVREPEPFISHVLKLTAGKAFFSFPEASGLLAAIRRKRYQRRTPLFLYRREGIEQLFNRVSPERFTIEKLARDYFVEVRV